MNEISSRTPVLAYRIKLDRKVSTTDAMMKMADVDFYDSDIPVSSIASCSAAGSLTWNHL